MIAVTIINPTQALELRAELLGAGLVQDRDFTWRYCPPVDRYWESGESQDPRVEFSFTNPAVETFYSLKWL